ncbi:MAG TPA: hypothetical protein VJ508_14360, partial [Saprospiraceae bacterium]|nr:hypothetical protein [Saprospiraceae bacterium]
PGGSNGSITVLASGGTGPYTYAWSNGGNGATISNLTAGNYMVTATDAHGCHTVKLYIITQPPAFVLGISQTGTNACFGDANVTLNATVSGGTPPYLSSWSNGVQGLSNPNLPAGTYTITITDDNGCTSTASSVVTQPAALSANVTTTNETSSGANDGTATSTPAGGTPAYTYLWSNGGTTSTISGLPPGIYTVTVTDSHGCTSTGSGQVNSFGCTIDVTLPADVVICNGEMATLTPNVLGGIGNLTYLWSTGATTPSITVSTSGNYCVTVTDMANCQDADCIQVDVIVIPAFDCPVVNESAPGMNDGAIQCDTISGIISYLWSNGATTPGITGLAPGTYCLTVTDINGCTNSQCFNVQAGNCNLLLTSLITDVACFGGTTGSISVNVDNGTAPITYQWSNGGNASTIDNLAAGSYSVTVTDGAGCVFNQTFQVNQSPDLVIQVDSVTDISQSGDPGSIMITVSGGVTPYTYLWTEPDGSQNA